MPTLNLHDDVNKHKYYFITYFGINTENPKVIHCNHPIQLPDFNRENSQYYTRENKINIRSGPGFIILLRVIVGKLLTSR